MIGLSAKALIFEPNRVMVIVYTMRWALWLGRRSNRCELQLGNTPVENWHVLFPWDEQAGERQPFLAETEDLRQWGGAPQIFVFACMHQLRIVVHQRHQIIYEVGPEGGPQHSLLYCHSAGVEGVYNHYDRLIPTWTSGGRAGSC